MENNKKFTLTVLLVAICITVAVPVTSAEQIHMAPGAFPAGATQNKFIAKATTGPSVLTPPHVTNPFTVAAYTDSLSKPAVAASIGKLENKDIATKGQPEDKRTDSLGIHYVIAVVLVAFLGMVSVIRRNPR